MFYYHWEVGSNSSFFAQNVISCQHLLIKAGRPEEKTNAVGISG